MNKENLKFRKYMLKNPGIELYAENLDKLTDEEFSNIRHNSFGASDSSRILGVNPFPGGTKDELYFEKANRINNDEIGKKPTVRMGKDLEPLILKKLEETTGQLILKPTDMFLNHITGQSVNYDGVWFDKEINKYIPREIKTVSIWGGKYYNFNKAINLDENPEGIALHAFKEKIPKEITFKGEDPMANLIQFNADAAGIPVYYYTQLQQQMSLMGAPYGTLTVINVRDWTLYEFTIERAQPIMDALASESTFLYMKLKSHREKENKKDGE